MTGVGTFTEPRKERRPIEYWKETLPLIFHKCRDTNKIIWPFQKAYYGDVYVATERVTVTSPDVGRWITPEAYTFRTLKATK